MKTAKLCKNPEKKFTQTFGLNIGFNFIQVEYGIDHQQIQEYVSHP